MKPDAATNTEPSLFGHAPFRGVVAVEPLGHGFRLFLRTEDGLTTQEVPFHPFLLTATPPVLRELPLSCVIKMLTGEGEYRYLLTFDTWHDCCLAYAHLHRSTTGPPPLFFPEREQQFLLSSGVTFFRGLTQEQVVVTFLASEVTHSSDGAVFRLAISDRRQGDLLLASDRMSERAMFEELSRILRRDDPDLLVGYGLAQQLPALLRRARNAGVRLAWGRDGSSPRVKEFSPSRQESGRAAGWCRIFGRSVVDLRHLLRLADRPRPGGLSRDRGKDEEGLRQQLGVLRSEYRVLAPAFLQLSGMVPYPPQVCQHRSRADVASALLVRAYLHHRHSMPPLPPHPHSHQHGTGLRGWTPQLRPGPHGPVVHCELRALLPAILLAYRLAPRSDDLAMFQSLLHRLTRLKREARLEAETLGAGDGFAAADSRRVVLGSLARGFYGLLASSHLLFADQQTAAETERLGRVLTGDLLTWLREQGAEPLELDRDGIYFIPPPGHDGTQEVSHLLRRLTELLPGEMTLSCDSRYRAMVRYKPGNYALLGYDGTLVIKGSSLTSGGLEPFLRQFLHDALRLLLEDGAGRVAALYEERLQQLSTRQVPVEQLARTETLPLSSEQYRREVREGKRHHSAVGELALRSEAPFHAGDRVSYYVTGSGSHIRVHEQCRLLADYDPRHPDFNVAWYAERLHRLYRRLTGFLAAEPGLF
ncbi:hypothetical protein [Trichlorobacter ammonificans]|uniref:DNA-directed DNA polymerase n=1 Tax=Trichlorobacter ammonificans TaxID=2916410 RepID=A0ABN8HL31_9BACT|nr:hypothetical protein [Trichlorobacter ammonificans]CAH2032288.1 putative DNA polymerase B, exonuclease [Trichlorobacter ammonificans]